MLLREAVGTLLPGTCGPCHLGATMRLYRSIHLKTYKTQAERPASGEGSSCHSHGSSAKALPLTDKLSGKVYRGCRKPRQSLPASGPGRTGHPSLTELAVPVSSVSAFCQAALLKIIPHEFYGLGDVQQHNCKTFSRNVDRFIKLRRFETISLHEVMQGLKVSNGFLKHPHAFSFRWKM